jgi:hypothetical protein
VTLRTELATFGRRTAATLPRGHGKSVDPHW